MLTKCHLAVLLQEQAKKYGNREAFIYQNFGDEEWKSISWNEASDAALRVSNAMLNLGIKVQEKVGVFSNNSLQYLLTDFGAWQIRAVTVPFYSTTSEEQVQFMVNDAKIRFIFAGEQEQYDKARHLCAVCPTLEKVIVFSNKVKIADNDPVSIYFDDFIKFGDGLPRQTELVELQRQADNDDLMCILYTSGTTGNSKGVILTHGQQQAAMIGNDANLPIDERDRVLDFLPFTHIFEKAWALLAICEGSKLIILNNPKEVQKAIKQMNPTCMSAVPRFWEKVYAGVQAQIDGASPVKKKIFLHALEVGRKHNIEYLSRGKRPPLALALEYKLINKTIFSLIRKELGFLNPNFFPTAGAAVSPEVEEFIIAIGLPMLVGYGLTESFATVSNVNKGTTFTVGSIGTVLPGLSVKISEEGEILLKGPTITKGYYNRPDVNAESFTADGYFRTGDVGHFKDGELYITERIKDLFKTSNGKYIAPQMIESKILVDKFVESITIIADARKFVSALIVPAFPQLEKWAQQNGISYGSKEELCNNAQVKAMLMDRIDTLQQPLASYEKIKRFTLIPRNFSIESGELTSTLKVKRNVVAKNYKAIIDKMYEE